jgi:excinuclease UvrABC ATPase subunit
VFLIQHNRDVISSAAWIIEMSPEGGNKGGRVIVEGTARALLSAKGSLTSQYLRE